MFTAGSARVPGARMRRFFLGAVLAMQIAPVARASDGSTSETVVWEQQDRDIVASYARDRDGAGTLRFRDLRSRRNVPVTFLVDSDKDLIANLNLAAMQDFNGLLVLTLQTSTGYVVQVFTFDDTQEVVTEVASTTGRWMPELMYFGDQADPAVGVLKQQTGSKGPQPALICGEKIYVLNQRTRRIDELSRIGRGRIDGAGKLDASCID